MNYHRYDHDKLEAADNMRIERSIYFNEDGADISALSALPLEQLRAMREESAAAERAVFENLQQQAAAWEEQAGRTLLLDKAIEYVRTPEAQHTANEWTQTDEYRHVRSNAVYRMQYTISENTRYDREAKKSIPYSYTLSWGIYTNAPGGNYGAKIAGQDRKVFASRADMEKYLNGRIKAYQHLFTELSPPIPQEYAQHFKVNGQLLPGYTVEGEQPPEQVQPPQEPKPEQAQEKSDTPEQEAKQPDAPAPEPRPVIPIVLTSEKPAEKLKEITDRLEKGIAELFDSEKYKEYLQVMSRFHNYSLRNTILIAMQKPDASLIAGFSAWKNNFQRNVMKGEKGIKIIAPSPFKVKQEKEKIDPRTGQPMIGKDGKPVMEEKEVQIPAYKVVTVFDVSQTEGRELPNIGVNELTGNVERFKEIFAALEKISPVPVGFEKITGGAHGYYHLEDKRIAIDEGMSELQTLKTLIHEIAHAKLHDIDLNAPKNEQQPRVDRRTREVEAESVAYTVCQRYGLDTSDYSFGYIAGWSSGKEHTELKGSLETIRSAAAEIIDGIDAILVEAQKDREQSKAQEQPAQQEKAAAPEYIYQVHTNPRSDSRDNLCFLQAYLPQEDGRAKIGDVLYIGTPEKCRELMGKLQTGELTQGQVKELYAKAQEAAQPPEQGGDTFTIYQLKGGDETRDFRFEPYDRLQAAGLTVQQANYAEVYSAELTAGMSLEDIFTRFNIDHPKDFTGHSLSVSDVVVLHQNGQDTAHYVDSVGFREVPEFLQAQQPQLTPDERMTGEQIRTPRGSFYVTDMSREQMEAAGYGFHHQSDNGQYLIMANGTRAFAIATEQAQRDNPLKATEQTAEQNYNMIDGVINNTPTVDELEAKVKAGEQISLVDLANAVKADKERGKTAKPEQKPSIRAQLRAAKEQQAGKKKTAVKSKNQDLEV